MAKEKSGKELAKVVYLTKGNATKKTSVGKYEAIWKKAGWKVGKAADRLTAGAKKEGKAE